MRVRGSRVDLPQAGNVSRVEPVASKAGVGEGGGGPGKYGSKDHEECRRPVAPSRAARRATR